MRHTSFEMTLGGGAAAESSLNVICEIDHNYNVVYIDMLDFDEGLVIDFLTGFLLREKDVLCKGLIATDGKPRYPHELWIILAGRPHPARLYLRSSGRYGLRLQDPEAEYLAQCQLAIEHILAALQKRDIEAFITGIDVRGRPEPNEGFLHLYVRTDSAGQDQEVEQLRKATERRFSVSLCLLGTTNIDGNLDLARTTSAYFEWDSNSKQVVRRGPGWST